MYILEKNCSLRGWKNIPYSVEFEDQPRSPLAISPALAHKLEGPVEYEKKDPEISSLIGQKILVPCSEDAALADHQRYYNYGCLHFDNVIFSITGRCNYNCMHCSVNAPQSPMTELPFEKICNMLEEMKECGLKSVVLIGGEPLIRPDFLRVVDEVSKRKMFIAEIFTNGSLVTEDLLDELDRRHLRPLFMLSFDGVGYHDKMRGIPGAEQDLYRCATLLHQRGYPVSANMCITRESIHSIWDTVLKLSELGVRSLTVYPPVECGAWEEKASAMGVTTQMIGEVYPELIRKFVAADYPLDLNLYGMIYLSSKHRKFAITPKWKTWGKPPERSLACLTFARELNISPEGILSPCYAMMSDDYTRKEMPDLYQMSLKEALTDSAFTKIMELTNADIRDHNPKCRDCEYLPMCGGGCRLSAFKKTGDLLGYDPQMCEFFENRIDLKFREAIRQATMEKSQL